MQSPLNYHSSTPLDSGLVFQYDPFPILFLVLVKLELLFKVLDLVYI